MHAYSIAFNYSAQKIYWKKYPPAPTPALAFNACETAMKINLHGGLVIHFRLQAQTLGAQSGPDKGTFNN